MKDMLNIALPKGRLGEKVYAMFEAAGFACPSIKEQNRKLIFENEATGVRYFWVKPSDVAIYVARGAADIGVAGKDILLEYAPDVYELLDLNVGKCRMAVAAPSLGLSDVIVDIVETGTTLKENDLEVRETVVPISARLIANKSSFKFKTDAVSKLLAEMEKQI